MFSQDQIFVCLVSLVFKFNEQKIKGGKNYYKTGFCETSFNMERYFITEYSNMNHTRETKLTCKSCL